MLLPSVLWYASAGRPAESGGYASSFALRGAEGWLFLTARRQPKKLAAVRGVIWSAVAIAAAFELLVAYVDRIDPQKAVAAFVPHCATAVQMEL